MDRHTGVGRIGLARPAATPRTANLFLARTILIAIMAMHFLLGMKGRWVITPPNLVFRGRPLSSAAVRSEGERPLHALVINMIQKPERYDVLDGMRGVAAICVCAYHLTQHSTHPMLESSSFAVDLFFCLSGFVVAHAYAEKLGRGLSTVQFLLKRLARLYPMYIVGIVIGALALFVKISRNETSLDATSALAAIALNAVYLPYIGEFWNQVGRDKINSPLFPANDPGWSLFFELMVNAVLAAVICNFKRSRSMVISIMFLAAVGLILWCVVERQPAPGWGAANLVGGIPRSFYGFFSGVLLCRVRLQSPITVQPWHLVAVLLVCFLTVARHWSLWLFATLFISPALVFLGSTAQLHGTAQTALFRWAGRISYPLYCIHFPIYSMATTMLGPGMSTSLLSFCMSMALAHLLQVHFELPASKMLNKLLQT